MYDFECMITNWMYCWTRKIWNKQEVALSGHLWNLRFQLYANVIIFFYIQTGTSLNKGGCKIYFKLLVISQMDRKKWQVTHW